AFFLWFYKEETPDWTGGFLRSRWADLLGAALIGSVIYSKPPHALLIVPPVLWAGWRRRVVDGFLIGAVAVVVAAGWFGVTALNSGEFNYQGGDRKTFYSVFPFDGSSPDVWGSEQAKEMVTNDSDAENVLQDFPHRFTTNVEYFLIGRHFGFVPYFFPGVVAILLWIASAERLRMWRVLTFLAVAGSAALLLLLLPFSWSGGGGPPGGR